MTNDPTYTRSEVDELRDMINARDRQCASYRSLIRSLEEQRSALRIKCEEREGALSSLDSEREANARLTSELHAANERIKELEPDALRYRWLRGRFTGFDFDWLPDENGANGESVLCFKTAVNVLVEMDMDKYIDAAITQERQ